MDEREQRVAHLERLSGELQDCGFLAELVDAASKPYVTIADARQPEHREQVHCELDAAGWYFCWPWQEPIGMADDLATAVKEISAVIRTGM